MHKTIRYQLNAGWWSRNWWRPSWC